MKEIFEFRINKDYVHLLFDKNSNKISGDFVSVVQLEKDDPQFSQIPIIRNQVKAKFDSGFYYGWKIKRKYTKKEMREARLFQIKIKSTFEPAGEECGTEYDETTACEICGANRKQLGTLKLQKSSFPKKDIARTIAGEVIVSNNFMKKFKANKLKGLEFKQVYSKDKPIEYFQPIPDSPELSIAENTITGIDPFDTSGRCEGEIYDCPLGHTKGLNLLSEIYVKDVAQIEDFDFFVTEQKIGVKRGLLRPEPLYLCSQQFRQVILNEKIKGFDFEIAHIE